MTLDALLWLALGIGTASALPLERWIRRRRARDPFAGMHRYIGADGQEWAYFHAWRGGGADGGGGDGGGGHCGGDGGGGACH